MSRRFPVSFGPYRFDDLSSLVKDMESRGRTGATDHPGQFYPADRYSKGSTAAAPAISQAITALIRRSEEPGVVLLCGHMAGCGDEEFYDALLVRLEEGPEIPEGGDVSGRSILEMLADSLVTPVVWEDEERLERAIRWMRGAGCARALARLSEALVRVGVRPEGLELIEEPVEGPGEAEVPAEGGVEEARASEEPEVGAEEEAAALAAAMEEAIREESRHWPGTEGWKQFLTQEGTPEVEALGRACAALVRTSEDPEVLRFCAFLQSIGRPPRHYFEALLDRLTEGPALPWESANLEFALMKGLSSRAIVEHGLFERAVALLEAMDKVPVLLELLRHHDPEDRLFEVAEAILGQPDADRYAVQRCIVALARREPDRLIRWKERVVEYAQSQEWSRELLINELKAANSTWWDEGNPIREALDPFPLEYGGEVFSDGDSVIEKMREWAARGVSLEEECGQALFDAAAYLLRNEEDPVVLRFCAGLPGEPTEAYVSGVLARLRESVEELPVELARNLVERLNCDRVAGDLGHEMNAKDWMERLETWDALVRLYSRESSTSPELFLLDILPRVASEELSWEGFLIGVGGLARKAPGLLTALPELGEMIAEGGPRAAAVGEVIQGESPEWWAKLVGSDAGEPAPVEDDRGVEDAVEGLRGIAGIVARAREGAPVMEDLERLFEAASPVEELRIFQELREAARPVPLSVITWLCESPVPTRSWFGLRIMEGHTRDDLVERYRGVLTRSYEPVEAEAQRRYHAMFATINLQLALVEAFGILFSELAWHRQIRARWRIVKTFRDPSMARAGFAVMMLTSLEGQLHELAPELLQMASSSEPDRRLLGVLALRKVAPDQLQEVSAGRDGLIKALVWG